MTGPMARVTAVAHLDHLGGDGVLGRARQAGPRWMCAASGRSTMLAEPTGVLVSLRIGRQIADSQVEVHTVLASRSETRGIVDSRCAAFHLERPTAAPCRRRARTSAHNS